MQRRMKVRVGRVNGSGEPEQLLFLAWFGQGSPCQKQTLCVLEYPFETDNTYHSLPQHIFCQNHKYRNLDCFNVVKCWRSYYSSRKPSWGLSLKHQCWTTLPTRWEPICAAAMCCPLGAQSQAAPVCQGRQDPTVFENRLEILSKNCSQFMLWA